MMLRFLSGAKKICRQRPLLNSNCDDAGRQLMGLLLFVTGETIYCEQVAIA